MDNIPTPFENKSPEMAHIQANLAQILFGNDPRRGVCAICGEPIIAEDFRDALSRREYGISGMCQSCQDGVFGTG